MSLRSQRGFTVIELLIVMVVFLVVTAATLTAFEQFTRDNKESEQRLESVEQARRAVEVEVRQLRNLAIRLNNNAVIDTAGDYDLIFQTSDPSRTWVRYCLDASSPTSQRLWQSQLALPVATTTSPVSSLMRSACPGTGWTSQKVVAEDVVNRIGGQSRPVFDVACVPSAPVTCPASPADFPRVISVNTDLFVDTTPNTGPKEMRVSSGVYLRNQNQSPVANFSVTDSGVRKSILNGSSSSDFENRTLRYFWFRGQVPTVANIRCNSTDPQENADETMTMWGANYIGTGVALAYDWPAGLTSPQTVSLVVCDPGDSYGQMTRTNVTFRTS